MRRATGILAVAVAVVVAFSIGLATFGGGTSARRTTTLEEVRAELVAHYYRPVPPQVLRLRDARAMVEALGDPYTELLDPEQYRLLQRVTTGSYSGVGVTLLPAPEGLLVTRLQPGPARLAGIRPGDTILAVDGVATAELTYTQALGRILGLPGSSVRLRILRGPHVFELRLVRKHFRTPAVHSRLVSPGGRRIGYIGLTSFTAGATQAVERAVSQLESAGARGLVLDLRGNPGGLLDQAVGVASLFLERGVITSTKGAHQPLRVYAALTGSKSRLPLVVLVDHGSASAAEVVAAALKDNRRALLVGEPSFGKALVQSIEPLRAGAALKLTIARYLTPAGVDLSRRGVTPDVQALDDPATSLDEGLATALRALAR